MKLLTFNCAAHSSHGPATVRVCYGFGGWRHTRTRYVCAGCAAILKDIMAEKASWRLPLFHAERIDLPAETPGDRMAT